VEVFQEEAPLEEAPLEEAPLEEASPILSSFLMIKSLQTKEEEEVK
jgi:hypothetical protein